MKLTCMEKEGTEILGRKYPKGNFHSEDIFSDRKTQTHYTVEKWIWVYRLDSSGLGYLSVTGYKTFSLQKSSRTCEFVNP